MDQLRTILRGIKKYHFWILCAIISIVSFATWMSATGRLAAETEQNSRTLDGKFSGVKAVIGNAEQPNASFSAGIKLLTQQHERNIFLAHHELYQRQTEAFQLSEFLTDATRGRLNVLAPDDPIPDDLRRQYQNEVEDTFVKLFKTLNLRIEDEEDGDFEGLIVWPDGVRNSLAAKYAWVGTPTNLDVRYSIEDYNIYRELISLLNAINENAGDHLAAVVKGIITLEIGQNATKAKEGDLGKAEFLMTTGPNGNAQKVALPGSGAGRPPGGAGKTAGSSDPNFSQLTNGRYVNTAGIPLAAVSDASNQQFKLMPVKLTLVVDQRRLPKVLAEIAEAHIPIEVLQLRFNPRRGAFNPFGGRGAGGGKDKGGGWGDAGAGLDGLETTYNDVEIELLAVMYLFKPLPEGALASTAEGEEGGETAPAEQPASPPSEPPASGAEGDSPAGEPTDGVGSETPEEPDPTSPSAAEPTEESDTEE